MLAVNIQKRLEHIPENLTCVGVRADRLTPGGGENAIPCRVIRRVENAVSTVLLLATPGGAQGRSLLRMELDKGTCAELAETAVRNVVPRELLLLTGGGL